MKRQSLLLSTTLSACLIASTAFAGAPIADVNHGAKGVDFALKGAADIAAVTLTVSGPGEFHTQKTFDAGQAPFLSLFNKDGGSLEAGYYKWTLVEIPKASGDRQSTKALSGRTQSGGFTVLEGGSIVDPDLPEGGFNKDQVFLDDLIVEGSACVGLDCNNGESFGFDTLRLKENNLRIKFQDTSASASFPGNDWQITANESDNGGLNKFSVDDIDAGRTPFTIEAGSIANALYVDSDGDVGVGTASPVVEVHAVDGNTPTYRLEQNGSSGFTPQTWDIAGNETNFFIRDVTNSSKLPFRIEPGAGDNAIYIDSTGNIGMGTNSPDSSLDVQGDGPSFRFTNTGTAGGGWRLSMNGASGRLNVRDLGTNNDVIRIDPGANAALFRVGIDTAGTTSASTVAIGSTTTDAILQVQGSIVVDGATVHADYVFASDYELDSIDDHVAFAMEHKHLPGLPKAPEGLKGPVDLMSHQMGILEELETAHLYIGQLNDTIQKLNQRLEKLENE